MATLCACCASVLPARIAGKRGRNRKFCSGECRDQSRSSREVSRPPGRCVVCGNDNPVPNRGPLPLYCSATCRRKGQPSRKSRKSPTRAAARCAACGIEVPRPHRGAARRYCSMTCRDSTPAAKRRSAICEFCCTPFMADKIGRRFCSLSCATSHKNVLRYASHEYAPTGKGHRGRAHRYGLIYEPFTSQSIFERDAWVCGLCSELVDSALKWPHPMSASLDHVVPMSRGGDHVPENTQCAHLRCNLVKGATADAGTAPDPERA